jgi:protein SCO1/2
MLGRPRNAALAALAALVLAGALVVVIVSSSGSGSGSSRTGSAGASAGPESGFDGAPFPKGIPAPDFTLDNQSGRSVSLGEYRGQVVLLTFLYSTCGATCVLIAQQIRGALDEMREAHARPPVVLIVSADPGADSRAHVARFLAAMSLSGRAQYLSGAPSRLRAVWRAYGVKPASVGRSEFDEYASVLLIDAAGEKRVLFESEELTPEGLSHDVAKLGG